MERCNCWEEKEVIIGYYHDYPMKKVKQICNGTREREECSCDGDESKCNFYPEKRKENRGMNTVEMWTKAQEDKMCYETISQESDTDVLYYQKDKGLFDEDGMSCGPEMWDYFDDLMNEQWRLRTMTKSEAEARFNIKIVGD